MLNLIIDCNVRVDLHCLAAHVRNATPNRPLPHLHFTVLAGDRPNFRLQLVPNGKDEIQILFDSYYSRSRVRATQITELPHLVELGKAADRLKRVQIAMGADQGTEVAEAFECQLDEVGQRLKEARWWLDGGLIGKAARDCAEIYAELKRLMRHSGVAFPSDDGPADESWGRPQGLLGATWWDLARGYEADLTGYLRQLLHNGELNVVMLQWNQPADGDYYGEWSAAWNDVYGKLMGPF